MPERMPFTRLERRKSLDERWWLFSCCPAQVNETLRPSSKGFGHGTTARIVSFQAPFCVRPSPDEIAVINGVSKVPISQP